MAGSNCDEALDRVFEYIDGEMGAPDLERIGQHLRECPPCEAEKKVNEKLKNMVKKCSDDVAPEDLRAKVMATIKEARGDQS
jgi:mycothiol system anti-sigma-R factor